MRETLTAEEVQQIRVLGNTPGITHQSVADKFSIELSHAKFIINRYISKDYPEKNPKDKYEKFNK